MRSFSPQFPRSSLATVKLEYISMTIFGGLASQGMEL
jgi:hypothetical protein